jgi:hypothetical protein
MENNVKENTIQKQDQACNEEPQQPKQTVPAPIPEKSAWKVETTEKMSEKSEVAGGKSYLTGRKCIYLLSNGFDRLARTQRSCCRDR